MGVGSAAEALWAAHVTSDGHRESVAAVRARGVAANNKGDAAGGPVVSASSSGATAASHAGHYGDVVVPRGNPPSAPIPPSSLPAGFFDDVHADAAARGIDLVAVSRAAKDAEVASFLDWAKTVDPSPSAAAAAGGDGGCIQSGGAARELAENEAVEDAAAVRSSEHHLYRARAAMLRDLVEGRNAPSDVINTANTAALPLVNEDELLGMAGSTIELLADNVAAALREKRAVGLRRPVSDDSSGDASDVEDSDDLAWRTKRARRQ